MCNGADANRLAARGVLFMAIWVVAMLVVVETTERLEFPLLLGVGLVTIMVSRVVWRPRRRRRER